VSEWADKQLEINHTEDDYNVGWTQAIEVVHMKLKGTEKPKE